MGKRSKVFPVARNSPKSLAKARRLARRAFVEKAESNDDDVIVVNDDDSPSVHPEAASSAGGNFKFLYIYVCV